MCLLLKLNTTKLLKTWSVKQGLTDPLDGKAELDQALTALKQQHTAVDNIQGPTIITAAHGCGQHPRPNYYQK